MQMIDSSQKVAFFCDKIFHGICVFVYDLTNECINKIARMNVCQFPA